MKKSDAKLNDTWCYNSMFLIPNTNSVPARERKEEGEEREKQRRKREERKGRVKTTDRKDNCVHSKLHKQ